MERSRGDVHPRLHTFIIHSFPSALTRRLPSEGDQPVLSACHPGTVSGIRLVGNPSRCLCGWSRWLFPLVTVLGPLKQGWVCSFPACCLQHRMGWWPEGLAGRGGGRETSLPVKENCGVGFSLPLGDVPSCHFNRASPPGEL